MFEKIIITIILILAAILVFSGCDKIEQVGEQIGNKAEQFEDAIENKIDPVEDAIDSKIDSVEDAIESRAEAIEDAVASAVGGNGTASVSASETVAPTSDAVRNEPTSSPFIPDSAADDSVSAPYGQPVFITPEAAKQIALNHAGVKAEDAVFDRTERDHDNGTWHYEIEFRVGLTEYEYDIHAETGTVLSFEKDN